MERMGLCLLTQANVRTTPTWLRVASFVARIEIQVDAVAGDHLKLSPLMMVMIIMMVLVVVMMIMMTISH